ncbi:MAG: hypothetical protein JJD92_10160 [Frankiaceae bacterium]|nr:hypothetical protein [Frankiaceae bacterium]
MRNRLALLLAATMLVGTGSLALADPKPAAPPLPCNGPLACADDSAMIELERRIADNIRFGQALEIDYRTPERVLGDVASGGAWGDSALWTGVYLAGESMRYAVAQDKLEKLGPDDGKEKRKDAEEDALRVSWTAQRDEALTRTRMMADKFHLLARIGREWQTELSPNTSYQPTSPAGGPLSFGGGVFQGEDGILMRGCAPKPADTPDGIGITPNSNKRIFGPFRWEDGLDYYCETAPSRDSYAGTLYGLTHAYDLVGKDDPVLSAQIRGDILVLAGRLVKYGWSFPRPHGNISVPKAPVSVPITGFDGHDFDNFISPAFMQQVPSARLNVTQSARHVAQDGSAEEKQYWDAVWADELATQLPDLALSMEVDSFQPNEGYYKYNLNHLTVGNTIRLETDPIVREEFKRALGVMDVTTGDDGNAHFESLVYGVTGEQSRIDAAVLHLGQWLDYRRNIEAGPVTNSQRCGQDLECVPQGELEYVQGGTVVTVPDPASLQPGAKPKMRARYPLPVALRAPTDFQWQRPPTQLNGSDAPTHQAPGIDYLTPYWTIRYLTEVAKPDLAPLPAWVGPSHR